MPRLSRQTRLVLGHLLDSAILAVTAGVTAALVSPPLTRAAEPALEYLRILGPWGIVFLGVVVLALGAMCPTHVIATVKGLGQFPRHIGLIVKTVLALFFYVLVTLARSGPTMLYALLVPGLWVTAGISLGLTAAYFVAVLCVEQRQTAAKMHNDAGETLLRDVPVGYWWARCDDQPIHEERANLFREHHDLAGRILNRLLLSGDAPQGMLPSIAIIGAYGSGKTSICNLVQDMYGHRRDAGEQLPKLLFCRYEAWQYVTGEAATKGLVEAATRAVLAVADVPELWGLPDEYVAAIMKGGGTWARAATSLFGKQDSPASVLSAIGEALERLGRRLVVFVDDLDRIEESATHAQQAVTQALNQLQNVPSIQYIVAVGPTRTGSHEGSVVTYDLLKLTRFQEVVPRVSPEQIVSEVRKLRDDVIADRSAYYPWAEVQDDDDDPLSWHDWHGAMEDAGRMSQLIELLDTPRALKSALRETQASWNSGLKGEINWYELLLACALRVSEPYLFEWIERDSNLFAFFGPVDRDTQRQEARRDELKKTVFACLRGAGPKRQDAVSML